MGGETRSFVDLVGGKKAGHEMGFAQKLENEDFFITFLYRGYNSTNILIYTYIAVFYDKIESFRTRLTQPGDINFPSYGVVLASGEGNPPVEVMQEMEEKYGVSHANRVPIDLSPKREEELILYRVYDSQNRLTYYYFAIKAQKYADFKKAIKMPYFDIEEYGRTLKFGFGNPTPLVMQEMEEKYGFDHTNMKIIGEV